MIGILMSNEDNQKTSNAVGEAKLHQYLYQTLIIYKNKKSIENAIRKDNFNYKTINGKGLIKISPDNADHYRKIIKILNQQNASYHTYQLRQERAFKVVLRNIHPSIPTEEISTALEEKGHKVRNIINIKHRTEKHPLPMFFINQEPDTNNKTIYNFEYLLNAKVKFEPPRENNVVVQCTTVPVIWKYQSLLNTSL